MDNLAILLMGLALIPVGLYIVVNLIVLYCVLYEVFHDSK